MIQLETRRLNANQVIHFKIINNGQPLSVQGWIMAVQQSQEFRLQFNQILKDSPFQAFFWEVKPITIDTLNDDFEFVMVNSQILQRIQANSSRFEKYFEKGKFVVAFLNLGGDAQLIVPTPQTGLEPYAHLAKFVRHAPELQINIFWKTVGEELGKNLGESPKWLSTAGLGVSWLHVRIDSRPKYYRYQPYRKIII
jgi:hypothetical protein